MILGPTAGNVGIGFAIPVNVSRSITDQLIAHGRVRRGTLSGVRRVINCDGLLSAGFGHVKSGRASLPHRHSKTLISLRRDDGDCALLKRRHTDASDGRSH